MIATVGSCLDVLLTYCLVLEEIFDEFQACMDPKNVSVSLWMLSRICTVGAPECFLWIAFLDVLWSCRKLLLMILCECMALISC